ncbi:MAG: type 1 glutamine amidotransferase [Propionibacteriaceae bacterium]|jgi:GMP synthase (glutamine-hydrolysing)|nr:type 1 glutamine amidotransferase [Propionibacteriaceae bacterium]
MKIAVVQLQSSVPLDRLEPFAEYEFYDPALGLPDVGEFDGLIVLGGEMSVEDREDYPWLAGIEELLRVSVAAQKPTLAICLGAQLLVTATGGLVKVAHESGPEQGICKISLRPEARKDPVLGTVYSKLGLEFVSPVMHSDSAVRLPKDAIWLASSERYPFHAFRIGSALGVQFHPETSLGVMRNWLEGAGIDPTKTIKKFGVYKSELDDLCRALAAGFVSQVADSLE